jgi:hypothetical protein
MLSLQAENPAHTVRIPQIYGSDVLKTKTGHFITLRG